MQLLHTKLISLSMSMHSSTSISGLMSCMVELTQPSQLFQMATAICLPNMVTYFAKQSMLPSAEGSQP